MTTEELKNEYKKWDGVLRALISDTEECANLDNWQRGEIVRRFIYSLVPAGLVSQTVRMMLFKTFDSRYEQQSYFEYRRKQVLEHIANRNGSSLGDNRFR